MMTDRSRSHFQLRPVKDGGLRLIWRYPFAHPEARANNGMRSTLVQWRGPWSECVVGLPVAERDPPRQITIGYFGPHGFSPARQWVAALDIDSVRHRIMDDMMTLYGPGGEWESPP